MRVHHHSAYPSTSHLFPSLYPSSIHLSFQFSSPGCFPLCLPLILLSCLAAFMIEGFMSPPLSFVCSCQRDTCCCILVLCRIAEFSCLLNLLTTLNCFITVLFHHIFTQPHRTSNHSHRSRSFPSSWVSVSLFSHATRARTHSTSRTTRIIHRSTVSVYPCTFTLATNRRQPLPSPSPRFPLFFKVTPFYRRGPRVTCWISLPGFPPFSFHI